MEFIFYMCSLITFLTVVRVITCINPIHALLYLIISLLAISGIFFSLGAYFAGALEIIIYASAIMVMFVFVVMMLNLNDSEIEKERKCLKLQVSIFPTILSVIILLIIINSIIGVDDQGMNGTPILPKEVSISLFSSYILVIELVSMLLLASLIVVFHIGREKYSKEKFILDCINNNLEKNNKKNT